MIRGEKCNSLWVGTLCNGLCVRLRLTYNSPLSKRFEEKDVIICEPLYLKMEFVWIWDLITVLPYLGDSWRMQFCVILRPIGNTHLSMWFEEKNTTLCESEYHTMNSIWVWDWFTIVPYLCHSKRMRLFVSQHIVQWILFESETSW